MSDTWDHYGPKSSAAVNQFTPLIEYVNTSILEKYRDEHLAPMNFKAGVLRFYDPKVSMTIMVNFILFFIFLSSIHFFHILLFHILLFDFDLKQHDRKFKKNCIENRLLKNKFEKLFYAFHFLFFRVPNYSFSYDFFFFFF